MKNPITELLLKYEHRYNLLQNTHNPNDECESIELSVLLGVIDNLKHIQKEYQQIDKLKREGIFSKHTEDAPITSKIYFDNNYKKIKKT